MCHHIEKRAREPVESPEESVIEEEEETDPERDEPVVRTTANADD